MLNTPAKVEWRRLNERYVSRALPAPARNMLVEAGAVADDAQRILAIDAAAAAARQLYPQLFKQEQQA